MGDFWHARVRTKSGTEFSGPIGKLTVSSLSITTDEVLKLEERVSVTCFGVQLDAEVVEAGGDEQPIVVSFQPSDELREQIAERLREKHGVTPGSIPKHTTDVDDIPNTTSADLSAPSGMPQFGGHRPNTVSERPPIEEPTTEPGGVSPLAFADDDEHTEDLTPEQTAALHEAFEQDAQLLELRNLRVRPDTALDGELDTLNPEDTGVYAKK